MTSDDRVNPPTGQRPPAPSGRADRTISIRLTEAELAELDARIARMQELIAKWTGIFEGVDVSDVDAVAEIYVRELFSKIDVSAL